MKYKLPNDKNLMSVRAVYEIRPGVQRETESSMYKDSLVLEGFGDTRVYDVLLYSVGENEKTSEPLTVQVNPTTAPVHLATKQLSEVFGGVSIRITNPAKTNLAVVLMGDTAQLGYQSILQTYYTAREKMTFSFRGLDTIPGKYSVYLRDRWNNLSDTITDTLTPWYEEFIPKNTWTEEHLPTDSWEPLSGLEIYRLKNAWNGVFTVTDNMFASRILPLPIWVTWDLGKTVVISRLAIWHRFSFEWWHANPKKFELYGSMKPNPDGSWDESWIPLGKFEPERPSGSTTITPDDIDYARQGIELDLEINDFSKDPFVPVRYIRFKCIETYSSAYSDALFLNQISFWGIIMK